MEALYLLRLIVTFLLIFSLALLLVLSLTFLKQDSSKIIFRFRNIQAIYLKWDEHLSKNS